MKATQMSGAGLPLRVSPPGWLLGMLLLLTGCGGGSESPLPDAERLAAWDARMQESPVETVEGMRAVLGQMRRVPVFSVPDTAWLREEGYTHPKFRSLYAGARFYEVKRVHILRYLAGNHRVGDFISPREHAAWRLQAGRPAWLLIDPRLLEKFILLRQKLRAAGLDPDALRINYAHRSPRLNLRDGGATRSQHLGGKALDLIALDLNRDGHENLTDKEILYKIVDEQVIRNEGGVGRYPGTMIVHMDVRGHRARWDHR